MQWLTTAIEHTCMYLLCRLRLACDGVPRRHRLLRCHLAGQQCYQCCTPSLFAAGASGGDLRTRIHEALEQCCQQQAHGIGLRPETVRNLCGHCDAWHARHLAKSPQPAISTTHAPPCRELPTLLPCCRRQTHDHSCTPFSATGLHHHSCTCRAPLQRGCSWRVQQPHRVHKTCTNDTRVCKTDAPGAPARQATTH